MDVLKDLIKRLEVLDLSQDPVEAKALHDWLEAGGWESLKPSLLAHTKSFETKEVKPITLNVRKYDEWKEHSFEVYPYNRVSELVNLISKTFNLKAYRIRFSYYDEETNETLPVSGNTEGTVGELISKYKPEDIRIVVLPPNNEYKGLVNMPVRAFNEGRELGQVLVPLTRVTTLQQVAAKIGERFPLTSNGTINFIDKDGGNHFWEITDANAWTLWSMQDFGEVVFDL